MSGREPGDLCPVVLRPRCVLSLTWCVPAWLDLLSVGLEDLHRTAEYVVFGSLMVWVVFPIGIVRYFRERRDQLGSQSASEMALAR